MQPGIKVKNYMMLSARTSAAHRLLFYIIGNCSNATGHRSEKLYDAVCPDKCSPPAAFLLNRTKFKIKLHSKRIKQLLHN